MTFNQNDDDKIAFLSMQYEFLTSEFGRKLKDKFELEKIEVQSKIDAIMYKVHTEKDYNQAKDTYLAEKAKLQALTILINLLFPDLEPLKKNIEILKKKSFKKN